MKVITVPMKRPILKGLKVSVSHSTSGVTSVTLGMIRSSMSAFNQCVEIILYESYGHSHNLVFRDEI